MINLGPEGSAPHRLEWNRPAEFTGSYRALLLSATSGSGRKLPEKILLKFELHFWPLVWFKNGFFTK